jgi:hypothetical protein
MKKPSKSAAFVGVVATTYYMCRTIEDDWMVGPISRLSILLLFPLDAFSCVRERRWDELRSGIKDLIVIMGPERWHEPRVRRSSDRIKRWSPEAGCMVGQSDASGVGFNPSSGDWMDKSSGIIP